MNRCYLTFCVCFLFALVGFSPIASGQKANKKQAEKLFEKGKYSEAYAILSNIEALDDEKYLYYRGVSAYEVRELNAAILDLSSLVSVPDVDKTESFLFLAKSFHASGNFQDASSWYKTYLGKVSSDDKNLRNEIIHQIKICKTGLRAKYQENKAFVENMGSIVNSVNDESYPVQSPNFESKYYFSSNRPGSAGGLRNEKRLKDEAYGKYYSDMYSIALDKGNWTTINAVDPLLNTSSSEYLFDFSSDGSILFFMKSPDDKVGQILTDTFSTDRDVTKYPGVFQGPLIGEIGDKYMRFVNDTTLIFSSNREGGFGGYDIYISVFANEEWQIPINLGEKVNTPYNEVSPYLSRSNKMLYFSSDRLESIGGLDIFNQRFSFETNEWLPSESMNIPINSTDDDLFFSVSTDGTTGVFTSNRAGGEGGQDMYLAYLKSPIDNQTSSLDISQVLIAEEQTIESELNDGMLVGEEVLFTPSPPVLPKKEIVLSPLYFDQDEVIIKEENIKILGILIDAMKVFPDTKVALTGSGSAGASNAFDLFFSVKRAEKVYKYLVENGIDNSRITLHGLGSNFPIGKEQMGGQVSDVARVANNRIDVKLIDESQSNLSIIYNEPVVAKQLNTGIYNNYIEKVSTPYFKIRVAETVQMFKDPILDHYPNATISKDLNTGKYIYYIGVSNSYAEIKQLRLDLLAKNMLSAKIEPFIEGEGINNIDLSKLAPIYPELAQYIADNNF